MPLRLTFRLAAGLILSAAACDASPLFAAEAPASETPAALKQVDPLDWPRWRGPEQNGISRETGLPESWNPKGGPDSNVLWKRDDLGGRSTPIVMHGKLYTLVRDEPGTQREGEKVVCLDAATGETLWENRFNVYLSDVPDTRVGWSSVVGDPTTGKVYALGVCGYFQCLDGETGKTLWSHSLHEEYGFLSTYGGRTNSPLVFEDLVIISSVVIGWDEMSKPAHRFMAFDKANGKMVWFNGTRLIPYDTNYSAPFVTVFNGQPAMVFGSGDGQVWALQPRTGQPIWNYALSRRGLNVSPIVVDNTVYMSQSEENLKGTSMGALVALDGRLSGDLAGKEKWFQYEVMAGKSSPLYLDGKLYLLDDGAKLLIYDPKTGEQLLRKPLGTVQRSSPLYADGKIYVCTNDGRWYTLKPTDKGVDILFKTRLATGEASDGSPIVSHGRLYVPTSKALYCIGEKDVKPQATPQPEPPQEAPLSAAEKPAHVQVVPCEVLMRPGQTQAFSVRLYNARGQLLSVQPATFKASGAGEVSAEGVFTAASEAAHEAAFVEAQVGDLTGKARIRIVPDLPWKFDFESGDDVPVTWIGGRVRYVPREIDGEKAAAKPDVLPAGPGKTTKLGTRSRAWFGQTDLKDYTIQADVMAEDKDGRMPDIGLINQRYTLELQGESQLLQSYTWAAQLRCLSSKPYSWKPNVWYTLKMTTETKDGKAYVRGKVWPRDEAEPTEWMVESVDETPHASGSPGLYGNSADSEFYIDNILVTPNETK